MNKGYAGKITNKSSMEVKAPLAANGSHKKPSVKTGGDLRAKSGK